MIMNLSEREMFNPAIARIIDSAVNNFGIEREKMVALRDALMTVEGSYDDFVAGCLLGVRESNERIGKLSDFLKEYDGADTDDVGCFVCDMDDLLEYYET